MILGYQDQEPYDPHGYTRDNSFEIRQMVNGIDQDLRDTRTQARQAALDRKVKAAAPLYWSLIHDPSNFALHLDHGGNPWSWAAFGDPDIPDPPNRTPPRTNPSGEPVLVIGYSRRVDDALPVRRPDRQGPEVDPHHVGR